MFAIRTVVAGLLGCALAGTAAAAASADHRRIFRHPVARWKPAAHYDNYDAYQP